jgi:signal transduction histidine kinase
MTTSALPPRSRGRVVWGTTWRLTLIVLLGLIAIPVTHGEVMLTVDPSGPGAPAVALRLLLDVFLGLAAIVLYVFRHRAPLMIATTIVLLSGISSLAMGAALFAVISIATRRRWQEIGIVAAAYAAAQVIGVFYFPSSEPLTAWQMVVFLAIVLGLLVVTGMYIGGRRQLRRTLAEKAESDRREHRALLEQARVSERARIAREMHDVLAHRLSLVALHAGVLEFRTDLTPELQRTTAGVVRDNAHLALTELREVLGVLRETDDREPDSGDGGGEGSKATAQVTRPQPTLANLADLVAESTAAGTPADLELAPMVATQLASLTDASSRHLYRIVQEGLTNARKHAPGQSVTVRIGGTPEVRVSLRLTNSIAPPGPAPDTGPPKSGLGLTGLGERVRLAGGELTAGVDAQDRFTLEAWLPWTT